MTDLAVPLPVWADIGAGDLEWARLMLAAGRAGRMVCVEKAPGPFARAKQRARHDGRIRVILGDGFGALPDEPEDMGGAGMGGLGGRTIAAIVRDGAMGNRLPRYLVVAPTHGLRALCAQLESVGYRLLRTRWVPEGSHVRWVALWEREPGGQRLVLPVRDAFPAGRSDAQDEALFARAACEKWRTVQRSKGAMPADLPCGDEEAWL